MLRFAAALVLLTLATPARAKAAPPTPAPARAADTRPAAPIVAATTVHVASYDVHLRVEADGKARVEHALGLRVAGGALRHLELRSEGGAKPGEAEDGATATADDGQKVPLRTLVKDDGAIRLEPAEERGLKRGNYTFRFAVRTDLLASGALRRDGVMYRLSWKNPLVSEGIDGMRVVFDLPGAPTEPRVRDLSEASVFPSPSPGTAPPVPSTMATLRRTASRDELELVRPRVARGESAVWDVRLDPRAVPAVAATLSPERRAVATPPPPPPRAALDAVAPELTAAALGLAITLLAYFGGAASVAGSVIAGGTGALAAYAAGAGVAAPAIALLFLALAALRSPTSRRRARAPGQWAPIRFEEAFPTYASWRSRRAVLAGLRLVVALAALAFVAVYVEPHYGGAPMAALAVAPVVAALALARRRPSPLASLATRLARAGLRAVPFGRMTRDTGTCDEVRLRVPLERPMPGLLAVEIGHTGERFELLVRVRDESAAARKLAAEVARREQTQGASPAEVMRASLGRKPDERVVRVIPEGGPRASVATLRRMAELLAERRDDAAEASEARSAAERRGTTRIAFAFPRAA